MLSTRQVVTNAMDIGVDYDDDTWCENLLDRYLDDTDESKHDVMTLEEFAAQEGVTL